MAQRKRGNGRRRKSRRNTGEIPISRTVYNGPIVRRVDRMEKRLFSVKIAETQQLTSSAGGIINKIISNNPVGSPNWSNWISVMNEYRVLGTRVSYRPYERYTAPSTTIIQELFSVIDRGDSTTAITSNTTALQFDSVKMHSLSDPWMREWKMADHDEAEFSPVSGGPGWTTALKLWSSTCTNSYLYGTFLVEYLIQFRGTGAP